MPLSWPHMRSIARCVLPVLVGPNTAVSVDLGALPDTNRNVRAFRGEASGPAMKLGTDTQMSHG